MAQCHDNFFGVNQAGCAGLDNPNGGEKRYCFARELLKHGTGMLLGTWLAENGAVNFRCLICADHHSGWMVVRDCFCFSFR